MTSVSVRAVPRVVVTPDTAVRVSPLEDMALCPGSWLLRALDWVGPPAGLLSFAGGCWGRSSTVFVGLCLRARSAFHRRFMRYMKVATTSKFATKTVEVTLIMAMGSELALLIINDLTQRYCAHTSSWAIIPLICITLGVSLNGPYHVIQSTTIVVNVSTPPDVAIMIKRCWCLGSFMRYKTTKGNTTRSKSAIKSPIH